MADFLTAIKARIEEEQRKEHPDYRISVYCDQHLGVKMMLAKTWVSVEYDESSADANNTVLWFCPKADCERCYEPTMFGYHWNSGKMGSRIRTNPNRQPRGNHPGLPFMYIGKVAKGRRFMCPLYKCDEQGPEVAPSVVDEEVQIRGNRLTDLNSSERKRVMEMLVFQSFASASGLPIDEGSAENRDPPYPDILCTISGQRYWFELGRIDNDEVREKLNPNRRKQDGGFSYDLERPLVDVVNSKSTKNYATDGAPVDLILHFDLHLGSAATVERLIHKHGALLNSPTTAGPFKRVWIFDEYTKAVVYPKRETR